MAEDKYCWQLERVYTTIEISNIIVITSLLVLVFTKNMNYQRLKIKYLFNLFLFLITKIVMFAS